MSRRTLCLDAFNSRLDFARPSLESSVRSTSIALCALLALGCAQGEEDTTEEDGAAAQPSLTSSASATESAATPSPTGPAPSAPSTPLTPPPTATVQVPVPPASSTVAPAPSMSASNEGGASGSSPSATAGAGGAGTSETTGGSGGAAANGGAGSSVGGSTAGNAGAGTVGMAGAGGAMTAPDDMSMSFFVTSSGFGDGGNLGGLDGADAFCTSLATAADPALATKTWHAYLSTDMVNARDRIGSGPWRNANLEIVANSVEELHAQEAGEALDATWPPADLSVALDENGDEVVNDVHDILTGSLVDGTVASGLTCDNWTSNSADASVQVGHSNRDGGGRPPYFNATHEAGCAEGEQNREAGTVTQGGGRGSIYCFAAD